MSNPENTWDPPLTDEYAVSVGLYCFYFPYGVSENYMKGMKITDLTKSPNVYDQKQVGHQLASGQWKNYITLMADAGDLTVKNHFEFERGTSTPPPITRSRIKGPAGTVMLGVGSLEEGKVDIFFLCGANVNEDGGIEATFGENIMSGTKFKLSGEPKQGTVNCNLSLDASLAGMQVSGTSAQGAQSQSFSAPMGGGTPVATPEGETTDSGTVESSGTFQTTGFDIPPLDQ